jgi:diguanylate cyclase (GGDEF)-like protein
VLTLLFNGLIAVGAAVLVASLLPVEQVVRLLPEGPTRTKWRLLRALIFLFITAYVGFAVVNWKNSGRAFDLLVPAIFLLGACFVFLVSSLSLQTTEHVQRIAVMEQENITDPLMGIHNRRYLDRRLAEEVERARRYNLPLSILLLDIDHFKRINDVYGHQVGDRVLSALGKLIVNTVRNTDVVARYGGEEILIIGTCTPPPPIPVFAERVRKTVEQSVLVEPSALTCNEEIRVTVSIGVASLGPGMGDVEKLVKSADDALYRAKHAGRNQVVINGPDLAPF